MGVDSPNGAAADRVIEVAAGVFEIDKSDLSIADSPQTIERWDSLNHLKLITAVEAAFGIRLPMQTVLKIRDIGGLVTAVQGLERG